jgi:hypothetical protein
MISSKRSSLLAGVRLSDEIPLLVAATLHAFDTDFRPTESKRENKITLQLIYALRRLQTKENWLWLADFAINSQADELDEANEAYRGNTDISFQLGGHGSFIWECKRLRFEGKSLYGEYRKEGMKRFISGKYAKDQHHGGMLGFVMDGDVKQAVGGIGKHIDKFSSELGFLAGSFKACGELADPRLHISNHSSDRDLMLYHCFLPLS